MCTRCSSPTSISDRRTGAVLFTSRPLDDRVLATLTFSSTIVFHSPHPGHLPSHLAESYPQLVQTHAVLVFADAIMIVVDAARDPGGDTSENGAGGLRLKIFLNIGTNLR